MNQQQKLKQQLHNLIKQIGLKDQIKKELRIKLAERLQSKDSKKVDFGSDMLRHRIISSIIKEHFDKIGCNYSASIFNAQSGCQDKMLERSELIELLNLNKTDIEFSLIQLIIQKSPGRTTFLRNVQIQTQQLQGSLSIQQKFAIMDLQFRRALQQRKNHVDKPSNKGIQQKKWFEKQLARFKQFQAHKIKIKIGQQWRKKFQSYAQQMQSDFRRRLDKMRSKEKNIVEQYTAKQKNLQERMRGWEVSAKSRIELIQLKQNAVLRQKVGIEIQRKKLNEEGKKTIQAAKQKCRQYQTQLLNIQKRIDYEVGLAKLALQQAKIQKQQQFASKRKFIDEQYGKLMGIKDSMDILKKQNERLVKQNEVLRQQCRRLRQELRSAYNQSNTKGDRLDNARDQLIDIKNEKKDLQIKIQQQKKLRRKRQAQVSQARKQLDEMRSKLKDQSQQQQQQVGPRSKTHSLELKMLKLRQQRKKDIQRFKLEP